MAKAYKEVKDSGAREAFVTGSRRDTRAGKGRFDLLPFEALHYIGQRVDDIAPVFSERIYDRGENMIMLALGEAMHLALSALVAGLGPDVRHPRLAIAAWCVMAALEVDEHGDPVPWIELWQAEGLRGVWVIPPRALARLAVHYENGARKYGDRNWERGQPASRYMDSAVRHINRARAGDADEDHMAAAAWNLIAALHTSLLVDMDELPAALADWPTGPTTDPPGARS